MTSYNTHLTCHRFAGLENSNFFILVMVLIIHSLTIIPIHTHIIHLAPADIYICMCMQHMSFLSVQKRRGVFTRAGEEVSRKYWGKHFPPVTPLSSGVVGWAVIACMGWGWLSGRMATLAPAPEFLHCQKHGFCLGSLLLLWVRLLWGRGLVDVATTTFLSNLMQDILKTVN